MDAQNSNASSNDISLSNNPFIWGHITLLAGVPWLLSLSMAGLAVGDPVFPAWFEIILLGFPAIALITWVQWQKPLSPFSLWVVAKPTESLNERDRRILSLIKQYSNGWYVTGWIAIAVSVFISAVFYKIYISAPLAQAIAPFPNWLRFLGILWAEFFFLLSNVLIQAGFSALRVQLTPESELLSLQPFEIAKIKNSFTNIAWRSPQLLKFFEDDQIVPDKLINVENTKSEVAEEKENLSPPTSDEIVEPTTIEYSDDLQTENESQDFEELEPNNLIAETTDVISNEDIIEQTEEFDKRSEFVADESFADESDESIFEPVPEIFDTNLESDPNLEKETLEEVEEVEVLDFVEEEKPELEAIAEPVELVCELKVEQLVEKAEVEANLDEEILIEEPEKLDVNQFVIDDVVEVSEIDVILDITETISAPEMVEIEKSDIEAIAETINLDLEIDDLIKQEPEILDNSSNDFDDELDELIAFNIYVENILQNYLEEPLEEVNEVEAIAEVAEANIPMNVETVADNLLAIKTEVTEEIPESLSEKEAGNAPEYNAPEYNEPEYNEPEYNEQEMLVDEFLARIEALNIADKANKESLDQVKEPVAEVDVFADLEALLDDKPLPENLE